jgi:DNA topoisomerase IB
VHPAVLRCYLEGKLERRTRRKADALSDEALCEAEDEELRKEERGLMDLLRAQLETRRSGSESKAA